MAIELAQAYVSIIPDTSRVGPGINSALRAATPQAESAGKSMGEKMASGLGKTLKVGALGAGAAAAGVLATSLTKGFQRLSAIEQAEAKLTGLGNSVATVGTVMEDAMASVKGTAFGLGDAASIAASAVAAGVKPGQDLQRTLKLTGDAATIAGSSLGEMGSIFGKVAASNKIQGDVIAQLNDRGIPIIQLLGEELGKTAEETLKLASEGKVGFDTFQNAMEKGLGGAALKAGNTVTGSFANMNAALGRFGATVAGPIFDQAAGGFNGITAAIDKATGAAKPFAEDLAERIDTQLLPALHNAGGGIVDAYQQFSKSDVAMATVETLTGVVEQLYETGQKSAPAVAAIVESLGKASGALGVSTWQVFLTTLDASATILDATLVPVLNTVAGLMEGNQGAVTGLVAAWLAFKTIPALVGRVSAPMSTLTGHASAATGVLRGMATATGGVAQVAGVGATNLGRFGSAVQDLGRRSPAIAGMQTSFLNAAAGADRFGRMAGAAAAAGRGVSTAASGMMGALGGPWGIAIAGAVTAVGLLATEHAKAAAEARAQEQAVKDLATTLDQGSGAVTAAVYGDKARQLAEDGSITTAQGLGISGKELTAASLAMGNSLDVVTEKIKTAGTASVETSLFFTNNADALDRLGLSAATVSGALAGNAADVSAVNAVLPQLGAMTAGAASTMDGLAKQVGGAAEENYNLAQGIGDSNSALTVAQQIQADFKDSIMGTAAETRTLSGDVKELGLNVKEVPDDKSVIVDVPTQQQRADLEALGVKIENVPGSKDVKIVAETQEAIDKLTAFVNQRRVIQIDTQVRGQYFNDATIQGPIPISQYADGGIQGLPSQATIASGRGRGIVQWAEGETGGEAFIPMGESKRARSTGILATVADKFGYRLEKYADGGIRNALDAARGVDGNKYVLGGTGPTNFDCSGFVGWLQQIVMGLAGSTKRLYTTYSLLDGATAGLQQGLGPAGTLFQVGTFEEHMAATIDGHAAESGGAHGTSGIDGGRASAQSSQFPHKFHLPNDMIAGYVQGAYNTTGGAARAAAWSDSDETNLKSAEVAVTQAEEARNAVETAFAEGKKTQADLDQANLKVEKAQNKVLDMQGKKDDAANGVADGPAPQAPALERAYTEQEAERIDLQAQVEGANTRRNEVYNDPYASETERLKADADLSLAQQKLEAGPVGSGSGAFSASTRLRDYVTDIAGIAFDAAMAQMPFELGQSRWWDMGAQAAGAATSAIQARTPYSPSAFAPEDIEGQLGFSPEAEGEIPEWVQELRKRAPKVYDTGGWLEPGGMAINLSNRPEPIFNSPEQLAKFAGGLQLAPEGEAGSSDFSINLENVTVADPKQLELMLKQMQMNQRAKAGAILNRR